MMDAGGCFNFQPRCYALGCGVPSAAVAPDRITPDKWIACGDRSRLFGLLPCPLTLGAFVPPPMWPTNERTYIFPDSQHWHPHCRASIYTTIASHSLSVCPWTEGIWQQRTTTPSLFLPYKLLVIVNTPVDTSNRPPWPLYPPPPSSTRLAQLAPRRSMSPHPSHSPRNSSTAHWPTASPSSSRPRLT